jgi:hypothetical protein
MDSVKKLLSKYAPWLVLTWAVSISLFIGVLHGNHKAEFKINRKHASQALQLDFLSKKAGYNVVHFLTPLCSCSKAIKDQLIERGPLNVKGVYEFVVLIDDPGEFSAEFSKSGFSISQIDTKQISQELQESLIGVPLLMILDEQKTLKYLGGYSDQVMTPLSKIQVKKQLTKLMANKEVAEFPVKGCAVSKKYQSLLDPLGVKYERL